MEDAAMMSLRLAVAGSASGLAVRCHDALVE
jgi:hypothetical protein